MFAYFLSYAPDITAGAVMLQSTDWVPGLGVNFDLRLDGLSWLFALLITGIGTAIFFYARTYLKGQAFYDRFFGYLCLFMTAMLGIVMADNILLLFIFWELTSISSFFLIGFNNNDHASRKSAVTALTVTGMGGFFLLAGLILIGQVAGTYQISELMAHRELLTSHRLYPLMLGLLCMGAFTKSAQFPFHFWLPAAMKAPTPVSAYLHSATMVKAGIYLLARFNPILGGTSAWSYTLMIAGGITMVLAAFRSLSRTDLKGILAYSTIAALGVLVFLIGMGSREAIIAASVFILVHALYKAALFLVAGIIDHETGTRDIRLLAGLRKVLLPVAIAGLLAALSSAGLPLTWGFIGKDLIYEASLSAGNSALLLTGLAFLTNTGLVAAGFLAGIRPFTGPLPERYSQVHLPAISMWVTPLILGLIGVLFGFLPGLTGQWFSQPAADVMFGNTTGMELRLWHGFTLVLLLSLLTLAAGTLVYLMIRPEKAPRGVMAVINGWSAEAVFQKLADGIMKLATAFTEFFHNGYLRSYHLKIIVFTEILLAYKLWLGGPIEIDYYSLAMLTIYEVAVVLILVGALFIMILTRARLTAVVSMSVIGYCICLMFVFYSAPDLAMTQFTIDTLTTVLFVLVLYKLPPFLKLGTSRERYRDIIVSLGFGAILCLVALRVHHEPINTATSDFYDQAAYSLAKGKNVVNVILVDFRGIDTMFETVVLSIAAIGVYNLLRLRLKPSEKE
ncbi:putative monovalent cation/H+ antiporter subunit A [Niabella terrae]